MSPILLISAFRSPVPEVSFFLQPEAGLTNQALVWDSRVRAPLILPPSSFLFNFFNYLFIYPQTPVSGH